MGNILAVEAAAATAVGSDMMAGNVDQFSPRYRMVRRIAVTGSAAAGDAEVELAYGRTSIGRYRNTSTGLAPVEGKDYVPVQSTQVCEPNEPLRLVITDASVTSVMQVKMETVEFGRR